jgi:hypothetical protein
MRDREAAQDDRGDQFLVRTSIPVDVILLSSFTPSTPPNYA